MKFRNFRQMLSCFSHRYFVWYCVCDLLDSVGRKKKRWFMVFHVNDVLWRMRQTLKHNIFVENIVFALYLI